MPPPFATWSTVSGCSSATSRSVHGDPRAHPGVHRRPRSRACGRPGALRRARPAAIGTLATHRGLSRRIVSTTLEDLAPRPPSTMGAHRSGPCRPIGTPRGTTATARVRPWVSASSPPRAAAGRKSRRRAAGDRGAQQFNVTDDCCWSSALDPQAYRVARGAVGPSLGIDRLARTHRMLHVGRPAMRDGWRPPVPTPRITQRVSRETVAGLHGGQLDRPEVDAAVADLGQRVVGATSSGGPGR